MAVVPIVTVPDKVLNKPAEKVREFDAETKTLVTNMMDTLLAAEEPEGAGLAAPQIGVSKQMIIVRQFMRDPEDEQKTVTKEYVMINPKIFSESKETNLEYESCLSVPNVWGKVERADKIKVKYLDENGEQNRKTAKGYLARVIQHEIDHLNGILFTSKVIGDTLTDEELDMLSSLKY